MVYLTHKWKNNRKYLYLEHKARIDGKVKRVFQIYLGAEDKIVDRHVLLNMSKLESRTYNFGTAILWQVAEKIGLRDIINAHTNKKRNQGISVGDYILISAINRCVGACSKNTTADWIREDYLNFHYQNHLNQISSQGYWNHFQYFSPEILETIQAQVTKIVLETFKIDLDLVLYDPTNFFTHQSIHDDDQIAQFGNSKEKRFDKRIVNLSLLTSKSDAIPLWHQTYEGNIHDANHFITTIAKITDFLEFLNYDLKELTLVFDKGNHSGEAFEIIKEKLLGFITAIRPSSHKSKLQVANREFKKITLQNKNQISYMKYSTRFHKIDGTLFVIYDRQMKKRSLAIFARNLKLKRGELQEFLDSRLNQHKWDKLENVEKKLNTICGTKLFKKIFQFVIKEQEGELKVSLNETTSEIAKNCRKMGKTAIFTNRSSWTAKTVIHIYRDKNAIEDSFKQMKDARSIAIRPMYHHANLSIHVHVFTCVMAYLLNTLARKILSEKGLDLSIQQLQNYFSKLKVTEIGRGQLKQPLLQLNAVDGDVNKLVKIFNLSSIIKELNG